MTQKWGTKNQKKTLLTANLTSKPSGRTREGDG